MINKKDTSSESEYPEEAEEKRKTNDVGSDEFYQGEKRAEKVDIPALRNGIKTARVEREEIYGSDAGKREAFIASLGRKNATGEDEEKKHAEYADAGISAKKRTALWILAIVVVGALAGGGYWFWSKKKQEAALKDSQAASIAQLYEKSVQNEVREQEPEPEKEPVEEIAPAEISVSVLNEGAAAGSAGRTKEMLVGKGYVKSRAGNGEFESTGSSIYYNGEKFKPSAEAIKEILTENNIEASLKESLTSQQESADVVIILGK